MIGEFGCTGTFLKRLEDFMDMAVYDDMYPTLHLRDGLEHRITTPTSRPGALMLGFVLYKLGST